MHASPSPSSVLPFTAAEMKAMQTIYPQYLDAGLTPKEGRRLTKAQAVVNPSVEEIATALHELGFQKIVIMARKSLPRSQGSMRFAIVPYGAVKVLLKEPTDVHYIKKSEFDQQTRNPTVVGLESKHAVLKRVAALIKEKGGPRPLLPTPAEILASVAVNQPKVKK
ncbi:unnamed protein product [Phytomonas sp. Hart1]|nr:unnamed protein product [Phytomonas sp. Hart1]|eukprot:CCW71855.1 unnamed protein product [Phytomonas sp. isolate Hart1]